MARVCFEAPSGPGPYDLHSCRILYAITHARAQRMREGARRRNETGCVLARDGLRLRRHSPRQSHSGATLCLAYPSPSPSHAPTLPTCVLQARNTHLLPQPLVQMNQSGGETGAGRTVKRAEIHHDYLHGGNRPMGRRGGGEGGEVEGTSRHKKGECVGEFSYE